MLVLIDAKPAASIDHKLGQMIVNAFFFNVLKPYQAQERRLAPLPLGIAIISSLWSSVKNLKFANLE